MFNLRMKVFPDSVQFQVFQFPVREESPRPFVDLETGEFFYPSEGHLEEVPFEDEEKTLVHNMPDPERSMKQSSRRTKNAVYDLARANVWEWFVTFTFAPDKVNRYDYQEVSAKLSKWLNNARRLCPDMVYLVVPELHKDGAFHFHGLFSSCSGLRFVDSKHVDRHGRVIYNIGSYKWGFTTATQISDSTRAASYLVKYITKDLCAVSRSSKRYWASRNIKRPVIHKWFIEKPFYKLVEQFSPLADYSKTVESPLVNESALCSAFKNGTFDCPFFKIVYLEMPRSSKGLSLLDEVGL